MTPTANTWRKAPIAQVTQAGFRPNPGFLHGDVGTTMARAMWLSLLELQAKDQVKGPAGVSSTHVPAKLLHISGEGRGSSKKMHLNDCLLGLVRESFSWPCSQRGISQVQNLNAT